MGRLPAERSGRRKLLAELLADPSEGADLRQRARAACPGEARGKGRYAARDQERRGGHIVT